jgi:transcription elongation factor GreA-like protein
MITLREYMSPLPPFCKLYQSVAECYEKCGFTDKTISIYKKLITYFIMKGENSKVIKLYNNIAELLTDDLEKIKYYEQIILLSRQEKTPYQNRVYFEKLASLYIHNNQFIESGKLYEEMSSMSYVGKS